MTDEQSGGPGPDLCARCDHERSYHNAAGCRIEQCGCSEFSRTRAPGGQVECSPCSGWFPPDPQHPKHPNLHRCVASAGIDREGTVVVDPSSERGQQMLRNTAFERPVTQGDPPPDSPEDIEAHPWKRGDREGLAARLTKKATELVAHAQKWGFATLAEEPVALMREAAAALRAAPRGEPEKTPERWALACKATVELIGRVNQGADLACEIAEALVTFPPAPPRKVGA